MTRRYFVPNLPSGGGPVSLPDAEAQHAVRVMRVRVGDEIELFDGAGRQCSAIITQIRRSECQCEAAPSMQVSREPAVAIDLGIALPKPDRARELIERLTELGVRSVTPIVAERSQRPPSDSLLEKLRRGVIEACKQCGRNQLMVIHEPKTPSEFVSLAGQHSGLKLIAHPCSESVSLGSVRNRPASQNGPITVAIGPEGGWSEDEFQQAKDHGFEPLDLGSRIYRIETAAVAVAAVLVA